jgi:hypothetical protein
MDQKPEQMNLKLEKASLQNGDIVRFFKEGDKSFFKNEVGFETEMIPEGSLIRIHPSGVFLAGGMSLPTGEIIGLMHYENELPTLHRQDPYNTSEFPTSKVNTLKLWNGDIITITELTK